MGTMLYVNASDAVLETIAEVPVGTAQKVRALQAEHRDLTRALNPNDERYDDVYDAHNVALDYVHRNATVLDNLLFGQGLQRFQSWKWADKKFGYSYAGESAEPREMLDLLHAQLGYADGPLYAFDIDAQLAYREAIALASTASRNTSWPEISPACVGGSHARTLRLHVACRCAARRLRRLRSHRGRVLVRTRNDAGWAIERAAAMNSLPDNESRAYADEAEEESGQFV